SNERGQAVWTSGQALGLRGVANSAYPTIQASLDRLSSAEADYFKIQGASCLTPRSLRTGATAARPLARRLRAACKAADIPPLTPPAPRTGLRGGRGGQGGRQREPDGYRRKASERRGTPARLASVWPAWPVGRR